MKLNLTLVRRVALFLGMAMAISTVSATDVPKNLGNDLDKLVESNIALKNAQRTHTKIATYNGFASERAAFASDMAIKEAVIQQIPRRHSPKWSRVVRCAEGRFAQIMSFASHHGPGYEVSWRGRYRRLHLDR